MRVIDSYYMIIFIWFYMLPGQLVQMLLKMF